MLIFFVIFSFGQLFASDSRTANEAPVRNVHEIILELPPVQVRRPVVQQFANEIEWLGEIERLEREATTDLQGCVCLGIVGMGMLLSGQAFPSGSNAYWWLTLPGFFISCIGGIAGGSYLFRKAQICCMRIGFRHL